MGPQNLSPRSHRLAALFETVQQSRYSGPSKSSVIATLAPFGRSRSWRATVTRFRALKVATLAPFRCFTFRPVLRLAGAAQAGAAQAGAAQVGAAQAGAAQAGALQAGAAQADAAKMARSIYTHSQSTASVAVTGLLLFSSSSSSLFVLLLVVVCSSSYYY